MNKSTLIIILFILGFVGIFSFIHYEMEQSRKKNVQAAEKIIKEDIPETLRETAEQIPLPVQKTGEAIKNVTVRQSPEAEQPVKEVSASVVPPAKRAPPQVVSAQPAAEDNSPFKSPVGIMLDLGTTVIRETDKVAQEFLPPLTSDEEQQIGAEIDKMIRANTPEWNDIVLSKKAVAVFNKLLPLSIREDITYRMAILDDRKVINAYAAPGGYVYVTRALLERFNSESAIAMCLGHEIGHLELRHTTDRLRAMMMARKIVGSDIAAIAQLGYQTLTNCYTKEQEFAADEFGFRISLKIGFQRESLLLFLDGLCTLEKEMSKKQGTATYSDMPPVLQDMEYFLQSHPYTAERMEKLKRISNGN